MDISIILATFQRADLLNQTLRSFCLLNTKGLEWEVLIVDNAEDRRTHDILMSYSDEIPLKYLVETRRGKNNALNRAIPEAKGEVLVFTDDDVIVDPNWLIEVWEGTRRWPQYYVFGGRILPKFPKEKQVPFGHPFFENAFTIANWDIPEGYYNADKVWGPNMAIRAFIFKRGWRFDPNVGPDGTQCYRMGSETDLTTRLERAGFKAIYLPRSIVFHQVRSEQMNTKHMYERAFRTGREYAYIAGIPKGAVLAGVPPYLLLRMIKASLRFALSSLAMNKIYKFDQGLNYWHTKGMMYEYRKGVARNRS